MAVAYERTFALDDIEILRTGDGGDGRTVRSYAAVFDVPATIIDQHGHYVERIARGAFDKTIRERGDRVGVFYHHGRTLYGTPSELGSVPIGSPKEIRADGRGLMTVARYNKSELAESVLEAIRNGDIRGQSFRGAVYRSNPQNVPRRQPGGALPEVTRTELGLTEFGPTPTPSYDTGAMVVRTVDLAVLAGQLSDEERAELLRSLADPGSDGLPPGHGAPGSTTTTPPDDGVAGTDGPQSVHPGRITVRHAALRAELIRRGIRP
jgi:uncharacterized protein